MDKVILYAIGSFIKNITLGLLIGLLIGMHGICIEKDKAICLLGRIKAPQIEQMPPKNMPKITDLK